MRHTKHILTAIAVSAATLGATPALAASADERVAADSTALPSAVLAAMQRDLGLSADQVKAQRALQAKAIELDRSLQGSLGAAYAGAAYDAKTGRLTVMVSDAKKVDDVTAAGAAARLVKHSMARLDATKQSLDVASGKAKGAGTADRRANGARQASVAGMTSWHVDTTANVVRVTVKKGHGKAAAASLAKYGDAVTVEESDLAPAPTVFMDGGDAINSSSCSAGINLRNAAWGTGYLLTAGHCVSSGSTLYGQTGVSFGPVLESWFPGNDDAFARNDNAGYWTQGPWVDYNPSGGGVITTRNYTDAPVGTTVCKAGITTKWTCGSITVKNETVTYTGGKTVYGLTRHSACVEKGDSGGGNVSVTSSYAAEGVTSGASMIWDGSRDRCRSVFGYQNISWYYPIADSLSWYGPRYGVGTW